MVGYPPTEEGLAQAISDGYAFVNVYAGGKNKYITGEKAVAFWKQNGTNVTIGYKSIQFMQGSFIFATAKNNKREFIIDCFVTDGGGIPRNGIVSHGLSYVKCEAITLSDFVIKASAAPAAILGLSNKGHLSLGADADITVVDLDTGKAQLGIALGKVIMVNGIVVGSGGTVLTTEKGINNLKDKKVNYQVIDISKGLGRGYHLFNDYYKKPRRELF